jgi:hypothetical protein
LSDIPTGIRPREEDPEIKIQKGSAKGSAKENRSGWVTKAEHSEPSNLGVMGSAIGPSRCETKMRLRGGEFPLSL